MDGKAIMSAGAGWLITETTMNGPHLFPADHRDLMKDRVTSKVTDRPAVAKLHRRSCRTVMYQRDRWLCTHGGKGACCYGLMVLDLCPCTPQDA